MAKQAAKRGTDRLTGRTSQTVGSDNLSDASWDDIAALAHTLWQARGCPVGSPEEDWFQAERQLRERPTAGKTKLSAAGGFGNY